jgi:serine/threonine-protein kinase
MRLAGSSAVTAERGEPRVVAERYVLHERIGVGANAYVYSALDRETGELVALKLLLPAFADDPDFITRFRREAQAASALRHPNIVRVLDWGADGDAYLAMELVRGGDLADRLARGALGVAECVRVAMRLAEALEAAHARGLVHRDVKPQNILLDEQGEPKLADFGIARALWLTQITRTNMIFGSPHYLSPEQARGVHVDERADLYGLGVVLYEMLTGRPPFVADTAVAVALKHVHERPQSPRSLRREIPRAVEAVVLRALAKDPRQRQQSAREFRDALARALPGATRKARPKPARIVFALPALLLAALITGGAALAAPLFRVWADRPQVAAQPPAASMTPAAASETAAVPTYEPTPISVATSPVPDTIAAPADTSASPTAAVAPPSAMVSAPSPTIAPPATKPAARGGPADAVSRFYSAITAHDLDGALSLWDARMRSTYPPATYLYQRFATTSLIGVSSASVIAETDTTATVAVEITEIAAGVRQQWTGYWVLVRGPSGWLLDQPALRAR